MDYELRSPRTPGERQVYHEIRRTELFVRRGHGHAYNDQHPDESTPGNYPLLLFRESIPVATIRIDTGGPTAYFRMVCVRADLQGGGVGRELLRRAEAFARGAGGQEIRLNSAPDAVAFYERCGFHLTPEIEPIGVSVPMGKRITSESRHLLRHFLAALAYRTQKALRGAPIDFADFRAATNVRTPRQLVWHMTGVIGYARTMLHGGAYAPPALESFDAEIDRFHSMLAALQADFVDPTLTATISDEQFLQGPLSDAMTHAGQLAMLRRMAGSPVPSENFIFAHVRTENVSADQAEPAAPDAWWRPDQAPRSPGERPPT